MNPYLHYVKNLLSRKSEIFVDTEVLCILLFGNYDILNLKKYKCVEKYETNDYAVLLDIIGSNFQKIVVTPQVIAEFSNHAGKDVDRLVFSNFINTNLSFISSFTEEFIPKESYLSTNIPSKLGLTDASIVECCKKKKIPLLSVDHNLISLAQSENINAVNYLDIKKEFSNSVRNGWAIQ